MRNIRQVMSFLSCCATRMVSQKVMSGENSPVNILSGD
jgi:hypothetical protein